MSYKSFITKVKIKSLLYIWLCLVFSFVLFILAGYLKYLFLFLFSLKRFIVLNLLNALSPEMIRHTLKIS